VHALTWLKAQPRERTKHRFGSRPEQLLVRELPRFSTAEQVAAQALIAEHLGPAAPYERRAAREEAIAALVDRSRDISAAMMFTVTHQLTPEDRADAMVEIVLDGELDRDLRIAQALGLEAELPGASSYARSRLRDDRELGTVVDRIERFSTLASIADTLQRCGFDVEGARWEVSRAGCSEYARLGDHLIAAGVASRIGRPLSWDFVDPSGLFATVYGMFALAPELHDFAFDAAFFDAEGNPADDAPDRRAQVVLRASDAALGFVSPAVPHDGHAHAFAFANAVLSELGSERRFSELLWREQALAIAHTPAQREALATLGLMSS
jgi:hypothetical protein